MDGRGGREEIRTFGWCFIAFSGRSTATDTIGDETPLRLAPVSDNHWIASVNKREENRDIYPLYIQGLPFKF